MWLSLRRWIRSYCLRIIPQINRILCRHLAIPTASLISCRTETTALAKEGSLCFHWEGSVRSPLRSTICWKSIRIFNSVFRSTRTSNKTSKRCKTSILYWKVNSSLISIFLHVFRRTMTSSFTRTKNAGYLAKMGRNKLLYSKTYRKRRIKVTNVWWLCTSTNLGFAFCLSTSLRTRSCGLRMML